MTRSDVSGSRISSKVSHHASPRVVVPSVPGKKGGARQNNETFNFSKFLSQTKISVVKKEVVMLCAFPKIYPLWPRQYLLKGV